MATSKPAESSASAAAPPRALVRVLAVIVVLALVAAVDWIAGYVTYSLGSYGDSTLDAFKIGVDPTGLRRRDADYHHGLAAARVASDTWGQQSYVLVTNSLGFKDRVPREVPLQSAGRRLMFIGDSFTEGIGVPWENTWVGIVAERLAEHDIDVLNAGVTSYCPKTAYYKTKALLAGGLQVSHLIFFVDVSDMADELIFNDFSPASRDADDVWTGRYVKTPYRPAWHQFSLVYRTILRTSGRDPWKQTVFTDRQSGASFVFSNFISEREGWTRGPQREWLDAAQRSAAYYVAKLAALCREHGIEFEIGIYPWPQEIEAGETQSRYRQFWLEFAAEHHLGCYDLHPVMLPPDPAARAAILTQDFIPNDVHWNAAGHRLVAAEFFRQYRERHPQLTRR